MKKHITVQQLKELNEQQLEKIMELIYVPYKGIKENQELNEMTDWDYFFGVEVQNINIQNMINILEINSLNFEMSKKFDSISERFEGWNIYISYIETDNMNEIETLEFELCDALWEAVKYLLK